MSGDAKNADSGEGEGRTEEGSSSSPHERDKQNGKENRSSDHADEQSGESEIPIGIPMTPEEWRQAKKKAERPDPGD
jgi:hypothetical protein